MTSDEDEAAMPHSSLSAEERRQNRRTAFVLLSIAAVFFAGVIAKYWLLS